LCAVCYLVPGGTWYPVVLCSTVVLLFNLSVVVVVFALDSKFSREQAVKLIVREARQQYEAIDTNFIVAEQKVHTSSNYKTTTAMLFRRSSTELRCNARKSSFLSAHGRLK